MRKFSKVLAVILAVLLVASAFAGCGKKTDDSSKNDASAKTYIIYSDNSFAPFEFLDKESNA